jgi:Ca2+-binding EF-hand superfamily protein
MDPMDDDDVPQAVKDAMRLHELAGKQQEEFEAKMAAQAAQAAAPAAPAPVGDPHSGPPAEKRSLVSASGSTKAGNFSAALAAQTPAEKRGALKANSLASVAEASGEGYRPKSPLAAAVARPTVPAEAAAGAIRARLTVLETGAVALSIAFANQRRAADPAAAAPPPHAPPSPAASAAPPHAPVPPPATAPPDGSPPIAAPIRALFARLDSDSSGAVSLGEFLRAIKLDPSVAVTLGLDASSPTIAALEAVFTRHDADGSRTLALDEFAAVVREAADEAASRGDEHSQSPQKKPAHENPPRLGSDASDLGSKARGGDTRATDEIFAFFDKDGDGVVTIRELIIGVRREPALARVLGLSRGDGASASPLDQAELTRMFQKWDLDGNNALDREEFGAVFGASVEGSKRRERRAIELGDAVMRAEDPTRDDVRSLKEELQTLKAQMAAMMEEKKSEGGDPPRDPSGATGSSALEFDGGYRSAGSTGKKKAAAAEPPRSLRGASYRSYLESPAFRSGARRARSGSPGSAGAGGSPGARRGWDSSPGPSLEETAARAKNAADSPGQSDRFRNGYWREPLNATALRSAERKRSAADVVDEPAPTAAYKQTWSDGLRNGDPLFKTSGGRSSSRSPDSRGEMKAAAGAVDAAASHASSASRDAASAEKQKAYAELFAYAGKRRFSRGFERMYLSPPLRGQGRGHPLADPPGVKTRAEALVGVVGVTPATHKEDLAHRGSMQPVSFHRNVLGEKATTHTSTPPGAETKYPTRPRVRTELEKKSNGRVWVPGF